MQEKDALELLRRWWDEVWGEQKLVMLDELLTDPFVRHSGRGTMVTRVAEYAEHLASFQRAFYRPTTTIDDHAFVNDRLWARCTSKGVSRETGEPMLTTWMLEMRFEDNRIAELWIAAEHGVDWSSSS